MVRTQLGSTSGPEGGAGVRPWRRRISAIFARSGGPPAAALITSAASRKYCEPIAAGVITWSAFASWFPLLSNLCCEQEAHRKRPETDGFVGGIDMEVERLSCHVGLLLVVGHLVVGLSSIRLQNARHSNAVHFPGFQATAIGRQHRRCHGALY